MSENMETISLINNLLSTQNPLLPALVSKRMYFGLSWGLVLASLTLAALRWRQRADGWLGRWLPLVMLLWCLLPGPLSPDFWLGLAFRTPSLLLALLCGWVLLHHYWPRWLTPAPLAAMHTWAPALALLGWVLLLDAFAVWPVSLYEWGFAPLALGLMALLAFLPWILRGAGSLSLLLLVALVLHLLLRLPTGNVLDVLLDPLLWLYLQLQWIWRRLCRH